MPRPTDRPEAYLPGLDGLRAVSVIAVVGYHLRITHFGGGFLGVGMFFTLSGFLITSILRREFTDTGTLNLRKFWLRRARRLLPGVVLLILVVLIATAIAQPNELEARWRDAIAALLYVSNWVTINAGVSYFDRFGGPGPLDHLWSLAIEEQFYVVWPVLFSVLMRLFRRRMLWMAAVTIVLAGVSFLLLDRFAVAGLDNTRAYEGTDTRAGGMLVGAALALLWTPRSVPTVSQSSTSGQVHSQVIELLGGAAFAIVVWLVLDTDQYDLSIYRWRVLLLSVATATLLACVVHPGSRLGSVFGIAPLRWIGERSYGIYLWHLPLVALLPDSFLADQVIVRHLVIIALTLLLAELSWTLVEDPIRSYGFIRALRLRRFVTVSSIDPMKSSVTSVPVLPSIATWSMTAAFGIAVLTACGLAARNSSEANQPSAPSEQASGNISEVVVATTPPSTTPAATTPASTSPSAAVPDPLLSTTLPLSTSLPLSTTLPVGPTTTWQPASVPTSCTSVAHIGDSTSIGLMSPQFLPDPGLRIDARYQEVGAQVVRTEISGARSIVERYKREPNAVTIVRNTAAAGHDGCWVFAMGTNDSANATAGSVVGAKQRIDLMMQAANGLPVMWPTVKTLINNGPYSDASMQRFNQALLDACTRYPNLRVYDWRSEVQDAWFQRDGIHFTSKGYAERARYIARALTRAFPADQSSPACVV
jgi:peptidoglycan/LPS O-acetylase OafA/YrhL